MPFKKLRVSLRRGQRGSEPSCLCFRFPLILFLSLVVLLPLLPLLIALSFILILSLKALSWPWNISSAGISLSQTGIQHLPLSFLSHVEFQVGFEGQKKRVMGKETKQSAVPRTASLLSSAPGGGWAWRRKVINQQIFPEHLLCARHSLRSRGGTLSTFGHLMGLFVAERRALPYTRDGLNTW